MRVILTLETVILCCLYHVAFSQDTTTLLKERPSMEFGAAAPHLSSPDNIQASDGTNLIRILVDWDDVKGADGYYVYRDDEKSGKNMKALLNKDGSVKKYQSPGIFDGKSLIAGKLYYYWIAAVDEHGEINLAVQKYDSGYIPATAFNDKVMPVDTSSGTLGNIRSEVMIKSIVPSDTILGEGKKFLTDVELNNRGDALSDNVKLSYYLSKDEQLDKEDEGLTQYNLEAIEAHQVYKATLVANVDSKIKAGNYYLIVTLEEGGLVGNTIVLPVSIQ